MGAALPELTVSTKAFLSGEITIDSIANRLNGITRFSISSEEEVAAWRRDIVHALEADTNEVGWNMLHLVVGNKGDDNPEALGSLLATGICPDVMTKGGFTPALICTAFGRLQCFQLLLECRADFSLRSKVGDAMEDVAKEWQLKCAQGIFPGQMKDSIHSPEDEGNMKQEFARRLTEIEAILARWRTYECAESLASLASCGRLYSVQNLIRRSLFVLDPNEFERTHDGKDAITWVRELGREDIAREIEFWLWRAQASDSIINVQDSIRNFPSSQVPDLELPSGALLPRLGFWNFQSTLKENLCPLQSFAITDHETYQRFRADVLDPLESDFNRLEGNTILDVVVSHEGSNDAVLCGLLLSTGMDPDCANFSHQNALRPVHHCAVNARPECLQLLIECRASLEAQVEAGGSIGPLELALEAQMRMVDGKLPWEAICGAKTSSGWSTSDRKAFGKKLQHVISLIVENSQRRSQEGPESLVELASRGRFHSIRNLMRRPGTLNPEEFMERKRGLNAQQWAIEHGRSDVAAEIQFWMEFDMTSDWMGKPFPPPKIPKDLDIKILGKRRYLADLKRILQPYSKHPVQSKEDEKQLVKIQSLFGTTVTSAGEEIPDNILLRSCKEEDPEIFGSLAALGIDLDASILNRRGWEPVEYCTIFGLPRHLEILMDCRAQLSECKQNLHTARTWKEKAAQGVDPWAEYGEDPSGLGDDYITKYKENMATVVKILEAADSRSNPDSIAHLARRGAFPALQYLLRRKPSLIREEEFLEEYEGKDAEGWAKEHRRFDIAAEIAYRKRILVVKDT